MISKLIKKISKETHVDAHGQSTMGWKFSKPYSNELLSNEVDLLKSMAENASRSFGAINKEIEQLKSSIDEIKKQVDGNSIMCADAQHIARKWQLAAFQMGEKIVEFEKELHNREYPMPLGAKVK